jgi:hypothetical protein
MSSLSTKDHGNEPLASLFGHNMRLMDFGTLIAQIYQTLRSNGAIRPNT